MLLLELKKINLGLSHKVVSIVKQVRPRNRGLELISLCDMRYRETGFNALARHLAEKHLARRRDPTAFTFTVERARELPLTLQMRCGRH